MVIPTPPAAALIVVQAEFLFELLIILLDFPTALRKARQASHSVANREITKEILGGLLLFFGPLHQQPDLFARSMPLMKTVRGLYSARPKSRFQPSFAA